MNRACRITLCDYNNTQEDMIRLWALRGIAGYYLEPCEWEYEEDGISIVTDERNDSVGRILGVCIFLNLRVQMI